MHGMIWRYFYTKSRKHNTVPCKLRIYLNEVSVQSLLREVSRKPGVDLCLLQNPVHLVLLGVFAQPAGKLDLAAHESWHEFSGQNTWEHGLWIGIKISIQCCVAQCAEWYRCTWTGRRFQEFRDRIVASTKSPSQRLSLALLNSNMCFFLSFLEIIEK